ncbi:MAG: methyltransferase domain-containing protein [Solirubrobacterales bacterium]|nr:methyltransferase domain-containing protein [Solirubrobacterales bacterium]
MTATEQRPGPDAIFQVVMGFMASKHLFVANEVGVFTALADGSATLEQLAERIGVPERTLRIIADAMVALGFIERDDGVYRNGAAADAFLSGRGPMNLSPALRFMNAIAYPLWEGLERAVRRDGPARGELTEEQQKIFSEGVEALTAGPAHALAANYDFGRHRRLLDVAGGTGSFLVAILSGNPALEGTLFERPEVVAIAERGLAASPVAERVSVTAGNAMESDLPGGHDVVLLANIIHYFLPRQNVELVKRVRAAVEPGARLLLVDWWTDPGHTQPLPAALMAGEFLANVGGDVYSEEEMHGWLAQAGWRPLERLPLAGPQSAIVAQAV